MTSRLTRRDFAKVGSAALLVASACGDDASPRPDLPDTAGPDDLDAAPDLADAADEVDSTADAADLAQDADDAPDLPTDTGPTPIGRFDPALYIEAADEFPFAVQAGDPSPDGAVLWTCHRPAAGSPNARASLVLRVFEDGAALERGFLYVGAPTTRAEGGFVHELAEGLAPDTRYRYCFLIVPEGGAPTHRSPIGHFRTALAPGQRRVVTFGGTSCVNEGYQPYRTLSRAAEADLDFFVLAGDTTYCDGAETVSDYRAKWKKSFDTDGYRGLLSSTGTYATWDDHEIDDDWNPETIAPEQLDAAKQVYAEHIAFRAPASGWRLWRSFRWGDTLEVFLLDCRSERLPSTRQTEGATYLSRAQMDWLERGLRESPCTFKLIINSVPITDMPESYPIEKDRWEGYPARRAEILSHIGGPPRIPGVLWLSGDFHFGAIARVDPPGGLYADQFEVFMGQGANMANPAWAPLAADRPEQFPFVTGTNNYVRFVCDPFTSPPRITATFIDGDGVTLHERVFELPNT